MYANIICAFIVGKACQSDVFVTVLIVKVLFVRARASISKYIIVQDTSSAREEYVVEAYHRWNQCSIICTSCDTITI